MLTHLYISKLIRRKREKIMNERHTQQKKNNKIFKKFKRIYYI